MAQQANRLEVQTPGEDRIVMTRTFDAPRDLVFEAHTSCEHMSRWWGPRRYEVTECDIDFREGGAWRIVHAGPDGERHVFFGEYREIVRPETISWTFGFEGMSGEPGVETVTFEEHDGVTTLTAIAFFDTVQERDAVLGSGMLEGATETWERLEEYLGTIAAA
jgi:uncharacterized protein YndB with AHSA1/START domain